MRLALFTTIYPASLPFLRELAQSLESQTRLDFDLWIALDGVERTDVIERHGFLSRAEFIDTPSGQSPAQLRSSALTQVVDYCDTVALVDSDDVLLPSRVESAIEASQRSELCAAAMRLIGPQGAQLGEILNPAIKGRDITRTNVFGLSNTTWRTSLLRKCLPLPTECRLADWMLSTKAHLAGATVSFDSTPRMLYRIHSNNIAPLLPPFSPSQVLSATQLVMTHYELLDRDVLPQYPRACGPYQAAHDEFRLFAQAIQRSPKVLNQYTTELNDLPPILAWWACVAHPSLEYLWKS